MGGGATEDGRYDVAVVGAGIVGLAHAYAAAKLGARVVVIERDLAANGASIRNFGFITVTGQERGEVWRMAMRTRDVWAEVAATAGIPIEHRGLVLTLRRPEAVAVAEAFLATEMGDGCELLDAGGAAPAPPGVSPGPTRLGALRQPARAAGGIARPRCPRLAAWLAEALGVAFRFSAAALGIEPGVVRTSRGPVRARFGRGLPGRRFRQPLSRAPRRRSA